MQPRNASLSPILSNIGQASKWQPILQRRDIESIKATLRAEFYGPIFLLEDTIYDHRLFPSLARFFASIFSIKRLHSTRFPAVKLIRALSRGERAISVPIKLKCAFDDIDRLKNLETTRASESLFAEPRYLDEHAARVILT